jgi:tripartite-type tricarboxylate transporter receptor subunit TctC
LKKNPALQAAGIAALALVASFAHSQAPYPDRPVRFVVAFAAGGYADGVARLVGQKLAERLGQSIVVENRGGAGGNLATRQVAAAKPDGYALLVNTTAIAINPSLYRNPGYDLKDFVPVAFTVSTPGVFTVHPSNPAGSLRELFQDSRGKRLTYATAGVGSSSHLAGDYLLRSLAGLDAVHVPYQGGAPAITAGLSNQVDVLSASMPPVLPHIRAGKLKVLAVSSLKPVSALPGVLTVSESGFPGFEESSWVGLFAPAGTSPAIVEKLNRDIDAILREPDSKQRFAALGAEANPMSSAEFADYVRNEVARWAKIVKLSGVSED